MPREFGIIFGRSSRIATIGFFMLAIRLLMARVDKKARKAFGDTEEKQVSKLK